MNSFEELINKKENQLVSVYKDGLIKDMNGNTVPYTQPGRRALIGASIAGIGGAGVATVGGILATAGAAVTIPVGLLVMLSAAFKPTEKKSGALKFGTLFQKILIKLD